MTHPAAVAIAARDEDALMTAVSSHEEACEFRDEHLWLLPGNDVRWFWKTVMTEEQYEITFRSFRNVFSDFASSLGFTLGVDVQGGFLDGLSVLYAPTEAIELFVDELPPERLSFLAGALVDLPSVS